MNWLPKPSLFDEVEAARLKRREQAQADLAATQALADSFSAGITSASQGGVDLAMNMAYKRLTNKTA